MGLRVNCLQSDHYFWKLLETQTKKLERLSAFYFLNRFYYLDQPRTGLVTF